MKLLLTTNPGIEDIAAEEARAKLRARILDVRERKGRIIVEVDEDNLYLVEELRSIHRVRILLAASRICPERSCLSEIADVIASSDIYTYISPDDSFAVRVERAGEHEYTSLDIARVAGDAVISSVRAHRGFRPRVDLDYPSKVVTVDVINDELFVSLEISGELSWHRRGYRVYEHPAALKPTIAYAMLILSRVRDGDVVLDPMCGGGTIPIEAALLLEDSKCICMDINPVHVRGAMMNARAAMVYKRLEFTVGDARRLHEYVKHADVAVSNPPYGIRMGSPEKVREVYKLFLETAYNVVSKRITMITTEHAYVRRLCESLGYRIEHERVVAHGGLWPHIMVLKL